MGDPLRRGILAAAVDRDLGFRYPVLSLLARCECSFAICVRLCIVRVSVGLFGWCRSFFMIGGGAVRSCGYGMFCYGLSLRLPLTANGSAIWRIKGERKPVNVVPSPIWYGLLPLHRKPYPALSPRRRRMLPQPLANDLRRERIAHIGTQSDLHKLHPSPIPI